MTTQQIQDVCVGRCNIYHSIFFVLFFFPIPLCCIMFPTHDFLRSMTHFPPIRDKSDFYVVSGALWLSWERASCLFPHFSVWRNEHTHVQVTSTSCCSWCFIRFVKRGIYFFFSGDNVSVNMLFLLFFQTYKLSGWMWPWESSWRSILLFWNIKWRNSQYNTDSSATFNSHYYVFLFVCVCSSHLMQCIIHQ